MSSFIEAERKGSFQYLEDLLFACKSAFEAACKYDDIPTDTKFAVFSKDNPFVPFINKGMDEWFQARQDYLNFGYCGIQIKDKAMLYKRPKKSRKPNLPATAF